MTKIAVLPSQRIFLGDTIRKYFPQCEIIFFGSRLTGNHRPQSDLDLCIRADSPLSLVEWAKLSEDLVESDLPFKVDLVDWHRVKPEFQQTILKKHEIW